MTTEERVAWLAERRKGIGGSDAAKVMNASPWGGPHKVWMDKVGLAEEEKQTEAMDMGLEAENLVAKKYAKKMKIDYSQIISVPMSRTSAIIDGVPLVANYDRIVVDEEGRWLYGVELKTASFRKASDGWGEEGTDQVPPHYMFQCQHYLMTSGLKRWDLAVSFGWRYPIIYHIYRNERLIKAMQKRYAEFWGLVTTKEPPPVDGSEDAKNMLNKLYPGQKESSAQASPEIDELVHEYRQKKSLLALRQGELDETINSIKELMQDTEVIYGPDSEYTIRWKASMQGRTSWLDIVDELSIKDEVIKRHTKKTKTARKFTINFPKE